MQENGEKLWVSTVFVLEVVPRQRRVYSFCFINLENPISVLYSTKFHPQRNTFLPFPRPLWGTLAHPERTGAALDSSKANAPRGTSQPPVYAVRAGKPRPTVICCEVADQNQYNKLLGIVRITLREFGSDRFQYSKVLEMMNLKTKYST